MTAGECTAAWPPVPWIAVEVLAARDEGAEGVHRLGVAASAGRQVGAGGVALDGEAARRGTRRTACRWPTRRANRRCRGSRWCRCRSPGRRCRGSPATTPGRRRRASPRRAPRRRSRARGWWAPGGRWRRGRAVPTLRPLGVTPRRWAWWAPVRDGRGRAGRAAARRASGGADHSGCGGEGVARPASPGSRAPWQKEQLSCQEAQPAASWHAVQEGAMACPSSVAPWQVLHRSGLGARQEVEVGRSVNGGAREVPVAAARSAEDGDDGLVGAGREGAGAGALAVARPAQEGVPALARGGEDHGLAPLEPVLAAVVGEDEPEP